MNVHNEGAPLNDAEQTLGDLEQMESDLRHTALQRVGLIYRDALTFDQTSGGYISESVIADPEPVVVFRMDSKDQYTLPSGRITRQKLYVYLPKGWDPNQIPDRFWVRHEQPTGVESAFYVSREVANAYYRSFEAAEIEPMIEEQEGFVDNSGEISLDNMFESAIESKRLVIKGLQVLKSVMRDDFELVPYDK